MIEMRSVSKSFGLKTVLRGVDLTVRSGEFVALVGPNGAGKTTLLRIAASLMRPSLGRVRINGLELPAQAAAARRALGVMPHQPLLYGELTAEENLRFYGRMYGVANVEKRIGEALDQVGLLPRRRDLARTFSRGMTQRLAIARAMLHSPSVLLLDEPHTGLDQPSSQMLDSILKGLAAARTVLMISHDLPHALALADRVAVLADGRIALDAPVSRFKPGEFAALYEEITQR